MTNTQPLSDYFINKLHLKELIKPNKQALSVCLGDFIEKMWSTSFKILKPLKLINCLKKLNTQFGEGTQEDAQEFLIFLLDFVHEELNRSKRKNKNNKNNKNAKTNTKNILKLDSTIYSKEQ